VRPEQGTCRLSGSLVAYAGVTDPGRVRRSNEDSLLLLPEAGMFAVADGLGGLGAGDIASSTALAHLRDLCATRPVDEGNGEAVCRLGTMIAAVNHHTYEQRLALGNNMATTLALVQFGAGSVLAAHVGDSRIYRWHGREVTRITSDHSLVNELYEQGVLTASQARQSPQRHVITRAIGAQPSVLPAIETIPVVPGDGLLLCTDGLTGMVTDEELATCFRTGPTDSGRLVERLVALANEAGGHDNITVLVVTIGN